MGNSFKLDDLLRDDDGVKPPQKKKGATGADGYALDDLLGPDSTTAPPAKGPANYAGAPAASGPTGDVTLAGRPTEAPVTTPAPRRGIMQRIGGALADLFTPSESTARAMAQGAQGMNPSAEAAKEFYAARAEDKRLLPTGDTRTASRRKADAVAVKRKYDATIGQRADNTSVAPDAALAPVVRNQLDTNLASGREHDAQVATEQAQAESNYTPEQHRDLERRGVAYAAKLNQQAMDLRASDPAAAEALHQRAELFNKKAANHGLVASGIASTDNNTAAFTSSLLGPISDPYAGQRTNLATAARGENVFTSDELQEIGRNTPVANAKETPLISGRNAATLAGALPWFVAGDAAVAGGIKGAAMLFPKFGGIAEAIGAGLEVAPKMGPARAGFAGIGDAAKEFVKDIPTLARRGATIGQVPGAAIAAREAQQRGEDPTDAALQSVVGNLAIGPLGEIVAGGAGSLGKALGRSIENIDRKLRPHLDPTFNKMGGLDVPPVDGFAKPVAKAVDAAREVEGKTPLGDQTIEGQHATIAKALSDLLDQKQAATPYGEEVGQAAPPPADRRWWESNAPTDPMIEPGSALRPREEPADVPLRSQRDIANERAGTPRGEADAVVQMERARNDERLARENEAQMAEQARIEAAAAQSAREKQGPLTLSQTIMRAGKDAEAGDPLAVEYKQAINEHIDALARVQDAGEKGPTTRDRISLARSKVKLDELRKKYGTQTGAAALLAIASGNDDLTDDEKRMVGLGAFAMGSTAVVKALSHAEHGAIVRALDDRLALRFDPGETATPRVWAEAIKNEVPSIDEQEIVSILNRHERAGGMGAMTLDHVREALQAVAPTGPETVSRGFVSRLRNAVETLPGKAWDAPRPAADWIGKLKGTATFSKAELERIMPQLEELQASKSKVTRADVLSLVDEMSPRIERRTLTNEGRKATGIEGDAENITDIDELEGAPHDTLHEQIAAREARITEIEGAIEEQQNDARSTMDSAESELNRRRSSLEDEIETNFPNADARRALQEATQYLHEVVEGEYIPRGAVDKAFDKLVEEGELYGDNAPRDPDSQHLDVSEEERDGSPVWVVKVLRDHPYRDGARGVQEFVAPTKYEALAEAERQGFYESGSSDTLMRHATVEEYVNDDGETEYAIMQGGHKIDFGPNREDLVNAHVEDNFEGADIDDHLSSVKDELERYAEALSEYNTAESEHYYRTEGDSAFESENEEIEKHRDEIRTLEQQLETTPPDGVETQALGAGEEHDPALAPVEQKVHGQPKFSSYQRIGGGSNYRELLNVWDNNPGQAYDRNHYRDTPNTAGHVRVEDHVLDAETPGLADLHDPELTAKDAAGVGDKDEARVARNGIREQRSRRAALQEQLDGIAAKYEAMPALTRDSSPEAAQLANEYASVNRHLLAAAEDESRWLARLREATGATTPGKKIAVMIESQSDWAQDAGRYGVKTPPTAARARELSGRLEELNTTLDALDPQVNTMRTERARAGRDYRSQYDAEYDRVVADAKDGDSSIETFLDNAPRTGDALIGALNEGPADTGHQVIDRIRTVSPALADAAENVRALHESYMEAKAKLDAMNAEAATLTTEMAGGTGNSVPASPYADTKAAFALNAARFLIDSAERGYETIGWSDAGNRVRNAHLPISAATLVYDQLTPNIMKSLLNAVGFKKVPIEKVYIRGNGHWKIDLSPAMRAAIRKNGLPVLGVLAMLAAPDAAQAQDGKVEPGKLFGSAAGGVAAGALIVAMATNRKLRSLVKENRELSRELMIDDLSGLANGRAFRRAKEAVDREDGTAWATWDANRFKKMNDTHGHTEGDKVIKHFGEVIRETADKLGIPQRPFRTGGDEFAFAVPKERAAEFVKAVEDASPYTKGDVTTSLTGAHADTFAEADALLKDFKTVQRAADPSLRREGDTGTEGVTLHANPIGPALKLLKRYPSSAGVAAVGAAMTQSDNEQVRRAGVPVMALGALSAIGSKRLYAGADFLGHTLVEQLRKSPEGAAAVRAFNPDALLTPEVSAAIREFERGSAQGKARAAEFSGKAKKLGPVGDRAVSDVLENEQWEPAQAQTADVFAVATELDNEYARLTQEQLAAGTLAPSQVLPNYGGPRRYAFYEAQNALADTPSGGGAPRAAKIGAQKSRTLDIPIREAEGKLRAAQASGDPAAITAAQDALDEAKVVQLSQRVERGEIREASYRAAQGIEKAHHNVASAKLFETLRNAPGTIHPEWQSALDDLMAAKDMYRTATTQADKDAAELLQNEAGAKISEITRRFKQRNGDYVSLPDTPAMGMLRGAVVQRDVAHSLEGFDAPQLYGKMLRSWKEIKTVFNVGTHIGNVLSNVTALHMGDVPVWLQPLYYKNALSDLKSYGEGTRALAEAGVMNLNAVTALGEGQLGKGMRSREGLEELLPTTRPETQKVLRENGIDEPSILRREIKSKVKGMAVGGALGAAKEYDPDHPEDAVAGAVVGAALGGVFRSKRADRIRAIYGHEDNIARLAVFLRRRKLGDTIEQATQAAVQSLGDFRSRSPALRMISSTVSPFIMYQAKAVPAFARNVVDHPWKYLSLMAAWGAVNELGKQEMGEVPETDIPLNQRKDFGYFFPGFTQLPFGDERGNKAAVDMARWTPASGLTTGAPPGSLPEAFSDQGMSLVTPGGPVIDAALQGSNVDPYTKGPLIKRDRPTRENVGALLNKAADFALPSSLGFHTTRLTEDMDNEDWTKFKNDLFGPLGIKPKYVRPGAVATDAEFTLERSLRDMKQELRHALRANKNEERVPELTKKYQRDVAQALMNFKERVGAPPSPALVNEFLTPSEP